jgi:adenylate cyclase
MTLSAPTIKPTHQDPSTLIDWIVTQGLNGAPGLELFQTFCDRAAALVPIQRGYCGMRVLHPQYAGFGHIWRRGEGIIEETYARQTMQDGDSWSRSPLRVLVDEGAPEIRRHLSSPEAAEEFPIFADFMAEGATDYFGSIYGYSNEGVNEAGTGIAFTWTSDAPAGFTDDDLALLRRTVPVLALAMRVAVNRRIALEVARAYLGRDAAIRVLSGEMERGHVDRISAVLLFADLGGFTALADAMPSESLVRMLNDYLACMAEPVEERGGQVLKFMGDGMLSTFEVAQGATKDRRGNVCASALDAALDSLNRIAALNQERRAEGEATMPLNIAVHMGDVLYGNVGSPERLDFTIIGPSVNEASRMEAMCDPLERNLLISRVVADAMPRDGIELLPLGKHGLRSVREPVHLYTVEDVPVL